MSFGNKEESRHGLDLDLLSISCNIRGIYNIPSWHNSLLCVGKT